MGADTIAAIATAFSEAGIGIIRVSGEDSFRIVDQIFVSKLKKRIFLENAKSHTLHYGYVVDGETVVDEVLVSVMKAPRSYTAEHVAEINCHGGILILRKIMELLVKHGARIAEPGEFTKRAFLNGRIDLSEAEAVMDLIQSNSDFALQASLSQLKGSVSSIIKKLRGRILYEIAFIESALDDPENYDTTGYAEKLADILEGIEVEIKNMIAHSDDGKILKEGIKTVILGKPNAGKSSLLNTLLGEERAIVTELAGTTRDILEENILLDGISLRMMDTAGIRKTDDQIEKIGVEKARTFAAKADLILFLVDSSVNLDESDEDILEILNGKRFIVLLNKSDLDRAVTEKEVKEKLQGFSNFEVIEISALKNQGIDQLKDSIKEMFCHGTISFNSEVIITNMRHKEALLEALESFKMVRRSIDTGMPEDFYSVDLMAAYSALGRIIGEEVGDDLVNEIFEKFCMGK